MGQAQSQSTGGDCSDCLPGGGGYTYADVDRPDPLTKIPGGQITTQPGAGGGGGYIGRNGIR